MKRISGMVYVLGMAAMVILLGLPASGQAAEAAFPNRPVRIIASAPGSTPDILARIVAQGLTTAFGQSVIVENRPVLLIADLLKRSTPDGHSLAIGGTLFWTAPLLQKTSYDPVKDFAPVTLALSFPYIVVVHPSVAASSVKDLIALAKAKPGALNYAQGPPSGGVHLAGALFKAMSGVEMQFVPFSAAAQGLNSLLGGETQFMIYSAVAVMPHIRSGRLRGLAVTSLESSALVSGMPTVAATGLPGYEYVSMVGAFVATGTPEARTRYLNQEIVRVLRRDDLKDKFLGMGADVVAGSPAQFAAKIKSEISLMGRAIKDAGIKTEN